MFTYITYIIIAYFILHINFTHLLYKIESKIIMYIKYKN